MSVKIMSQVWEDEGIGPTDRLILLSLADHANDEGVCYPSVARLVRRTGLSERAVQTAIRRLEEAGRLKIERGSGPKGCNVFTVCTPAADAPPQQMHPAADAPTPRSSCGEPPQELHPNRQEPSGNRQKTDHPSDDPSFDAPNFSEFWNRWPLRKVGKQKARTAFQRLSIKNRRAATQNVKDWGRRWRAAYPNASDMHPSTYLNGRRWEDEIDTSRSSATPNAADPMDRWKKIANG